jgi:type IV secretory pathway VirB3-like protein
MNNNHKIYTSLLKPPLPLGITKEYIIFLLVILGFSLPLIFLTHYSVIIITILVILILYFLGASKLKKDSQYFSVMKNIMWNDVMNFHGFDILNIRYFKHKRKIEIYKK